MTALAERTANVVIPRGSRWTGPIKQNLVANLTGQGLSFHEIARASNVDTRNLSRYRRSGIPIPTIRRTPSQVERLIEQFEQSNDKDLKTMLEKTGYTDYQILVRRNILTTPARTATEAGFTYKTPGRGKNHFAECVEKSGTPYIRITHPKAGIFICFPSRHKSQAVMAFWQNPSLLNNIDALKDPLTETIKKRPPAPPQADFLIDWAKKGNLEAQDLLDYWKQQRELHEQWVVEFGPLIAANLYSLCGNKDLAADLTNETFLKAWASDRSKFDGKNPGGWLMRISQNIFFDHERARKYHPQQSLEPLVEAGMQWSSNENTEREMDQIELKEDVLSLLGTLSKHEQAALILREYYEYSYEEISAALGISNANVKSLIFRARKSVRETVKKLNVKPGEGVSVLLARLAQKEHPASGV